MTCDTATGIACPVSFTHPPGKSGNCMRIAYILNSLGIGGAECLVVALAERMAARGHSVCILTLREELADQWPTHLQVIHLRIRKNPLSFLRGFWRAMKTAYRFRPHIIHSHNFHGNIFARSLKLAFPSIAVVSTLHNEYEGGRLRMLGLKLTDGLACCTVAVSQAVAERALHLGIVPKTKCSVIANGIDIAQSIPDPERRQDLRTSMCAGHDFVWITAGRIVAAKDYISLLRAFAQVHADVSRTQLWIAGNGDDPEYQAALRIETERLGIDESVRWLGLRRDLPALLDAADGFVLASAWEGMPLALAEAMAMQKPIVATGVGGVAELTGNCGIVVPPRDPDALATAMLSILNTPAEAREFLGCSARRRVIDNFNIEAKADLWEALYRDIVAANSD
jgi:glycosyltransferase involved in cell wall biosynthesis